MNGRVKALLRDLPLVGEPLTRAYRSVRATSRGARRPELAQLEQRLGRRGPQVVGPWPGGAETELLYWLPFLRLLAERGTLDPTRVHVVATPEKHALYRGIAAAFTESAEGGAWLAAELAELIRPYRDGRAGTALPLRLGAIAPLDLGGTPVAGHWSEASARALFAGVPAVVVEPEDPVLRRDVALAERVAQRLGSPFTVVQPQFAFDLTRAEP